MEIPCKVCNHPQAPDIIIKLREGKLTWEEAARMLDVSPQLLRYHMDVHQMADADAVKSSVDVLVILEEIIEALKERFDEVKTMKPGLILNERMLTMITRELRESIIDLEKLTGRLQSAPLIQLQQINIHYEKMLAFISNELCSDCRQKVIKYLEATQ